MSTNFACPAPARDTPKSSPTRRNSAWTATQGLAITDDQPRISTGSSGLDDILGGGLDRNRMYLYEGRPGTGKTTLALQFLLEGAQRGEPVLYVALSETEDELRLVAKRHGWSLSNIEIFELVPPETVLDPERELTVLHPAEVELSETTKLIFDKIDQLNPSRIVFDSLSELLGEKLTKEGSGKWQHNRRYHYRGIRFARSEFPDTDFGRSLLR
jgi:KaiC/GvpD/RAD55 family RecA-like ATPase